MSRHYLGYAAILVSSLTFATSGTLVKPLLATGWTPGSAVIARLLIAALVLAVPAALAARGRVGRLWSARRRVAAFAVFGIAIPQLGYFSAVQRIPVGTALMIEYLAPVGLVLFAWARTRRRPAVAVLAGSALAVLGLVGVLQPGGAGALDPVGVGYAVCAALGMTVYWTLAARADDGLPALVLTTVSLAVAGLVLLAVAAVGVLPFAVTTDPVPLAGWVVPWWLLVLAVAVLSAAIAYVTGIVGTVLLGSRIASFVALVEVVFAATLGWLLLGEALSWLQLAGAALILGGVVLVRTERTEETAAMTDPPSVPQPA